MINLCSSGHDEICFEGRSKECPVCAIIKSNGEEITRLTDRLSETELQVKELLQDNAALEVKLNEPVVHAIHRAQASLPS